MRFLLFFFALFASFAANILIMFISKNLTQFKQLFANQLKNMLSPDELGAFILVLANAQQDESLKAILADDLKQNFIELKQKYDDGSLQATDDDLAVFKQLLQMNLDALPVWSSRREGDWQVFYNSIRALRPARVSSEVLTSIKSEFDAKKFHFNKPFLKPEILWEDEHEGLALRVLYNKFPFAPYHLIVVASPQQAQAQYLTKSLHHYIFSLVLNNQEVLPGLAMGYNSYAAGASVNHLHFQGFIRSEAFPVEHSQWRHNGGDKDYPVTCKVSGSAAQSWSWVEECHEKNQPYNLLYRAGKCYLLLRVFQGSVELPSWLNGCGWLDLCGVMTLSNYGEYERLSANEIEEGLKRLV